MRNLVFFSLVIAVLIFFRLVDIEGFVRIAQAVGLALLAIRLPAIVKDRRNYAAILLALLFIGFVLANWIYWGGVTSLRGLFFLSALGYALALSGYLDRSKRSCFWVATGLAIAVATYIFWQIELRNVIANEVLRGSRNHIVTILLALSALAYLSARNILLKTSHSIALASAFVLNAVVCILYTGRTGLVVGLALLLFVAGFLVLNGAVQKKVLIPCMALLIGVSGYELLLELMFQGTGFARFERIGADSVRWDINQLVWGHFVNFEFVWGYSAAFWSQTLGISSHNSFAEIYSVYGWFGSIVFVLFTLHSLWRALAADMFLAFMLSIMVFRSFFDSTFFSIDFAAVFLALIVVALRTTNESMAGASRPRQLPRFRWGSRYLTSWR